jgi:hypothetical protein
VRSNSVFRDPLGRLILINNKAKKNLVRYFDEPGINDIVRIERTRYNSLSPFVNFNQSRFNESIHRNSDKLQRNSAYRPPNGVLTPNVKSTVNLMDTQNKLLASEHSLESLINKTSQQKPSVVQRSEFQSKEKDQEFWIEKIIHSDEIAKIRVDKSYQLSTDPTKTGNKHFYNMLRPTFYKKKVEKKMKEMALKNQPFTQE